MRKSSHLPCLTRWVQGTEVQMMAWRTNIRDYVSSHTWMVLLRFAGSLRSSKGYEPTSMRYSMTPALHTSAAYAGANQLSYRTFIR